MASNAEMVDYIWPISTNYVFGGSRWDPYDTDCSGIVCAAFWHVHGVNPYDLGDWTGAQWNRGLLAKIWWGTTPYLPWGSMQKGDVIFTSTSAPSFDTGNGSHVGFYTGDPNAPFLSHYANGGPYVTAVNGVYGGNERYFGVARYLPGSEDEVSAFDIWNYKNKDLNGDRDVYQMMTDMWVALCGPQDKCTSSLAYMNKGLEKVDVYQIVRDGRDYSKKAWEAVTGVRDAVAGMKAGNVDVNMLAEAVADKLASRMAE